MVALRQEIIRLQIEGTSQRFPATGDHDYIVGTIDGIGLAINCITAMRKREEDLDGDEEFA